MKKRLSLSRKKIKKVHVFKEVKGNTDLLDCGHDNISPDNTDHRIMPKQEAQIILDKYNYEFGETYRGATFKIAIICPQHDLFHSTISDIKQGINCCPKCQEEKKSKAKTNDSSIQKIINKKGYKLLKFTKASEKVLLECPMHGPFESHIGNIKKGYGCKECAKEKRALKRVKKVEEIVNKAGYEFLPETRYINTKTKMLLYCPKHDLKFEATLDYVRRGYGCKVCGTERKSLSLQDIIKIVESFGCKFLYKESGTKLSLSNFRCKCPTHGDFTVSYSTLKDGRCCHDCTSEVRTHTPKYTIEDIRKMCCDVGVKLVSQKYFNYNTPICINCPKHGIDYTTVHRLKKGHACKKCSYEKIGADKVTPYEQVKKEFDNRNYILIDTEYTHGKIPLRYICKKHIDKGIQKICRNNLINGEGCWYCGHERSNASKIGELNPQWKGGHGNLNKYLRDTLKYWKIEQFNRTDHHCELSKKKDWDVVVHHMTPVVELVDLTLEKLSLDYRPNAEDYTPDELVMIADMFKKLNREYANPIVMSPDIHTEFHKYCGGTKEKTSFQQLKRFCDKYYYHFPERYLSKLI